MAGIGRRNDLVGAYVGRQRQEQEPQAPKREIVALPVTALTTAGVTLYTVPTNASFQIQHFLVTNYSSGAETFNLYIVPSGGSAGNSNIVYSAETVAANSAASPYERWGIVAPAGSTIEMTASTNSTLNVTMSGMTVFGGDLM